MIGRRGFIAGLAAAFAAPAIVRASSLMPVKKMPAVDVLDLLARRVQAAQALMVDHFNNMMYGDGDVMPLRYSGLAQLISAQLVSDPSPFPFQQIQSSISWDRHA